MRNGGGAPAFGVICALVLGGCSAIAQEDEPQSATVAVVIPGGENAPSSLGAVPDAVAAAFGDVEISGWTIDVVTLDADSLQTDDPVMDDVVAIVGGMSNDAIRRIAPAADDRSILFVSPYDDDPAHTRGADPLAPVRPFETYYTMSTGDDAPLVVLANYAVAGLQIESFAAFEVGAGDRSAFVHYAKRAGAKVPVSQSLGSSAKPRKAITAALAEDVQGIYVSGSRAAAADLVQQIRGAGFTGSVVVSPELATDEFLDDAGAAADDVVSVAAPTLVIDTSISAPGLDNSGPFGATAYDAGVAVATVLMRCLPSASSASSAREGCAGEMSEVVFDGVTGDVAFNEFGERMGVIPEVILVEDGRWAPPPTP